MFDKWLHPCDAIRWVCSGSGGGAHFIAVGRKESLAVRKVVLQAGDAAGNACALVRFSRWDLALCWPGIWSTSHLEGLKVRRWRVSVEKLLNLPSLAMDITEAGQFGMSTNKQSTSFLDRHDFLEVFWWMFRPVHLAFSAYVCRFVLPGSQSIFMFPVWKNDLELWAKAKPDALNPMVLCNKSGRT